MKRTISIAIAVYTTVLCASCMSHRQETAFFSNFSIKRLVESGKSSTRFSCDAIGGGGGADFNRMLGVGSGGRRFNSHKSDSFTCRLKSNESFDEADLFSVLKLDVERALHDNGAQITDRGSSGAADFYFVYVVKDVRGRVQIAGQRIGTDNYNVHAILEETNN
ncbi:MAG TPA: hypothetical protein VHQ64_16380 [Pyrinomonadaceae bacterium]|jgi:hypothetical protein|nr:hypothetical protein [Pyrinomonadaceae bacterium]